MMINSNKYNALFDNFAVIGMIHLAGEKPINRALEELQIYEELSIDAAIIENYHGSISDVEQTLKACQNFDFNIKIGVNVLGRDIFTYSFDFAKKYDAEFIQVDAVSGKYLRYTPNYELFDRCRKANPDKILLGGVWPKYYTVFPKSNLMNDISEGMNRCDTIVVTGEATGTETPTSKIIDFRKICENYPLVVGAGVTADNAHRSLVYADGCIVGSAFKHDELTNNKLDVKRIKNFMDVVKVIREYRRSSGKYFSTDSNHI